MYSPSINNVMAQKDSFSFLNVDPFPFTNANLDDPLNMPSMDDEDGYDSSPPFTKKTLTKAERRAEHNAIERARRESLNNKFQQLAQALPNLMNYRRPSKSQIVEKALDWVKKSISREERYRYQVIQLQKENKKLLAQLTQNQHSASETITSPVLSPSASISTPTPSNTTTARNHQQQYLQSTYNSHLLQQQQYYQQHLHHHQNTPHPSVSATTDSSTSSSSIRHHLSDFVSSSATTTAPTAIPSSDTPHHPFLYDLPAASSWLSTHQQQSPPSSLASHTYSSMDDLSQAYDRKDIDPAVFQSPPANDFYLDTMMIPGQSTNRHPPPSPGYIQPTASRSTPAFSSRRR